MSLSTIIGLVFGSIFILFIICVFAVIIAIKKTNDKNTCKICGKIGYDTTLGTYSFYGNKCPDCKRKKMEKKEGHNG